MPTTMTAVVARRYGPPGELRVEDLPVPRPGPGQIQVRVRAASVNPADVWNLSGVMRDLLPLAFPLVPGGDFAGTVTETGAGVTRFAVGEELFGVGFPRTMAEIAGRVSAPPSLSTGSSAEYAVFEADTPALAVRPPELAAEHAATLSTVGLAALAMFRAGGFRAGETVLVVGATGGVGGVAIPLLAAAGAHVIATALPEDERYVRELGAAEVIDYRSADPVAETLRLHPGGVDALVSLVLPGDRLTEASRVLRPNGRVIRFATPNFAPTELRSDLRDVGFHAFAHPGDLDRLAAAAAGGTLPCTISRRYLLKEGPRAYADLAGRHTRGKLVIVMPDSA
ncbi:NADP-dependent oxidoreductase [Actinoallomurus liliacearum]|uniref:NADP-dependent oxidoreductase n=1 Tax=Actinoallomurus liliacearum TaxID=1080073 RepID=A0ABP8TRJ8_9ACTN